MLSVARNCDGTEMERVKEDPPAEEVEYIEPRQIRDRKEASK